MTRPKPCAFIQQNLRLQPAPSAPEIGLYTAHPGSGLRRLLGRQNDIPPYWAYHWAGGSVLVRYILDQPGTVAGKRVIDIGTGSGIVGIVAAKCGARHVTAVDIDPIAVAAARLNAETNHVALAVICEDILDNPPPDADLLLVGDLFYEVSLASRVLPYLRRCADAGIQILVGDPGREPLPLEELSLLAEYPVADFGEARGASGRGSGVYTLRPHNEVRADT
jgi:predicted nicotinamide N-methyase